MSDPVLFLLAVATLLATPGPTNTLMATAGATSGIRPSLPLLLAELGGYLIAIFATRAVLAPIVAAAPPLGVALKLTVAVYLVWLAIKLWRRPLGIAEAPAAVSLANVFVTTLLNPKALIFALSVFPPNSPALVWYVAGFALVVIVAGGSWILIGWGLSAASGRSAGLIPRVSAVALLVFAGFILRSAI